MIETTYKVIRHRGRTYAIEITEPSRPVRVVNGFKTRAEAESWITGEMMAGSQFSDRGGA